MWAEKGEKNNSYFLGLEKKNQECNVIRRLMDEKGEMIHGKKEVLTVVASFYNKLYRSQEINDCDIEAYMDDIKLPQ